MVKIIRVSEKEGTHMKQLFNLLLVFVSFNLQAGRVKIYYQHSHFDKAQLIKAIFETKYQIPPSLISIEQTQKCQIRNNYFLEVCVNKDTSLEILENKNTELIKSSLSVFYKGLKNEL